MSVFRRIFKHMRNSTDVPIYKFEMYAAYVMLLAPTSHSPRSRGKREDRRFVNNSSRLTISEVLDSDLGVRCSSSAELVIGTASFCFIKAWSKGHL